jgi:cytochrome P450
MHGCAQCLLDSLLLARDEAGAGMERRSLRDELMTLLVAGQETSAINLAWSLAFLAAHPAAQQRAAQEVQQVRRSTCSATTQPGRFTCHTRRSADLESSFAVRCCSAAMLLFPDAPAG